MTAILPGSFICFTKLNIELQCTVKTLTNPLSIKDGQFHKAHFLFLFYFKQVFNYYKHSFLLNLPNVIVISHCNPLIRRVEDHHVITVSRSLVGKQLKPGEVTLRQYLPRLARHLTSRSQCGKVGHAIPTQFYS